MNHYDHPYFTRHVNSHSRHETSKQTITRKFAPYVSLHHKNVIDHPSIKLNF